MKRKFTRVERKGTRKSLQIGGSGTTLFKNTYVISIDKNTSRFIELERKAKVANLRIQHWPGIVLQKNSSLFNELPLKGIGKPIFSDRLLNIFNLGTVGCFLAHRGLLTNIASRNPPELGTLILEDDVEIFPDLFNKLAIIQPQIPSDWDILFLDKFGPAKSDYSVSKDIVKIKKTLNPDANWGFCSYIVKNSSIKTKILPLLEHMFEAVDIQVNLCADKLNLYLARGIIPINQKYHSNSTIIGHEKKIQMTS